MNKIKIQITLIDLSKKHIIETQIETLETDFYIQKYCINKEIFINDGLDVSWVFYLCEKKIKQNLNNYYIQSYKIIK